MKFQQKNYKRKTIPNFYNGFKTKNQFIAMKKIIIKVKYYEIK